ncbi:ATP-grasp domain-containing protein [Methylomonas koyamae]|uniref:ATP-grasp domain-containing protein n=1 Tax=Methylomonas koyamae TaxID=702114 RepID=UPI00112D571E|nr:ATP-grasp domain-containing protein [Methylomonas koyamae]TPQ25528.1 ATP-dependent carboxylate-amine ligase [Methylomonas koyamae]
MPRSIFPKCLLAIAKSARMLTRMCTDIGCEVVAIDCYADADTLDMARQVYQTTSLAWNHVSEAVHAALREHAIDGVIYGSGFEAHPETLTHLQGHKCVFGNSAEVFQNTQNKPYFFEMLDKLGISYPAVDFAAKSPGDGWIFKPWHSHGGIGISRNQASAGVDGYWQRFIDGQAMSVLFAAHAQHIEVIGFNRQWCVEPSPGHGFVFGGISSQAELPATTRHQVTEAANKLAAAYRLRGLNTLDFMLDAKGIHLLEINPRISASAQLYGKELLLRHLATIFESADICAGKISTEPRAYQTIYATKPQKIESHVIWPDWAVDRPVAGSIVGVGQPICSIIAGGKNSRQVAEQLEQRQAILQTLLESGY